MDRLIRRFDAVKDDDLMLCEHRGVAYQRNMARGRIAYDAKYLARFRGYAGTATERALNAGRVALLRRHVEAGARVLDYGAGSGAFVRAAIEAGYKAHGFDICAEAVAALKAEALYAEDAREFGAITMWDSLEHMEDPEVLFRRVQKNAVLLVSLPVFQDLRRVRESKHYKPGEHLYYFTEPGFVEWMALWGFRLLERSAHEVEAGRESIAAFAFRRDLPDYHDHIAAYMQMHSERHYGDSATELYLADVAAVVRRFGPKSILDYGCGRSSIAVHFWRDGERRIVRYDPAIPKFKDWPEGRFDLVLCMDVLEHIPMAYVDRVLDEVRSKGSLVLFTISTKPARARLPDGRNAHVTLLRESEWTRWLEEKFGVVQRLPYPKAAHSLLMLAGRPEARAQREAA